MEKNQIYFIDVINLLPIGSDCFIQAPDLEDEAMLGLLHPTQFDYYKSINLTGSGREQFLKQIETPFILNYFQNIEIKFNDKLLFEGHDGMEHGTISKSVVLPQHFIDEYVNGDYCIVSADW
jgi:hypothetical protein